MTIFESFWPKTRGFWDKNDLRPLQSFSKNGVFGLAQLYTLSHFCPNPELGFWKKRLVATQKPRGPQASPDPSPHPHFLAARRKVLCPKHSTAQREVQEVVLSEFLSREKCLGHSFLQKTAHFAECFLPKHWLLRSQCLGIRQLSKGQLSDPFLAQKGPGVWGHSSGPFWPTGDGLRGPSGPNWTTFQWSERDPRPHPRFFFEKVGSKDPRLGYPFGVWAG